jgi:hypothetical protein
MLVVLLLLLVLVFDFPFTKVGSVGSPLSAAKSSI